MSRSDETGIRRDLSRREFVALSSAGVLTRPWLARAQSTLTVQDVIAHVHQALGGPVPETTVDGLKAGRADMRVTGIATTAMATLDVLRRAAARGHNLVISYEPTFYAKADQPSPEGRATDAVFATKRALIDGQPMAVIRLHDQWLARKPDPMMQGLAEGVGGSPGLVQDADTPHRFTLGPMSLRALVANVKSGLGARGLRVIGAPDGPIRRIAICPGPTTLAFAMANVGQVDALVVGEPREWEVVEYMQDVIATGAPKALILIGRVVSEDPGMQVMARWLKPIVPEVPVDWIAAGDPYWRPATA